MKNAAALLAPAFLAAMLGGCASQEGLFTRASMLDANALKSGQTLSGRMAGGALVVKIRRFPTRQVDR